MRECAGTFYRPRNAGHASVPSATAARLRRPELAARDFGLVLVDSCQATDTREHRSFIAPCQGRKI